MEYDTILYNTVNAYVISKRANFITNFVLHEYPI